jgi:hypothetical protein
VKKRLAIETLLQGPHGPAQLRAFLAGRRFPIVEGNSVTFVFYGQADAVHLRHWIYGLETATALHRVQGTDLWHLTLEIPPRSRVEYKYEMHRGGGSEWIEDPLNPNRARDPFGANSVCRARATRPPSGASPTPSARPGTLEDFTLDSASLGHRRGLVYLPARYRRTRQYPLHRRARRQRLPEVLGHEGRARQPHPPPGNPRSRGGGLHRLARPAAASTPTTPGTRGTSPKSSCRTWRGASRWSTGPARCLMGASFGAVASLSTAHRYPGFWGRLLLQSGSFAFTDIGKSNRRGPLFDRVVEFVNEYRAEPSHLMSERVFMSCGVYESLIYENRSLVPLLTATGMDVRSSRPATATTGKTGATACAKASRGCSPVR